MPRPLSIEERVTVLEIEMDRLQSDYESEKGTRARANTVMLEAIEKLTNRVVKLQMNMASLLTGIAVISWIILLVKK